MHTSAPHYRKNSEVRAAVDGTSVLDVNQPYKYIEQEARSRSQGNQTMPEVKSLQKAGISPSDGSQDHKLQIRGLPDFIIKELDATEEDWNLT